MTELIAEIGQNHNGDINLAFELIRTAKANGADAAKFQVYDARTLFPKENNPWYEYNCQTELSREQIFRLAEECQKQDIEFIASVFDVERVEWLEEINVKRYKIASRSIGDMKLIHAVVATGKPMIVSLGMWEGDNFPEIDAQAPVGFLYCISKYPTPLSDLELGSVDFTRYAGFSDHTIGTTAALVAFSLGARILEKHFTLDKKMHGPDHSGSMTPDELRHIHKFRLELAECL